MAMRRVLRKMIFQVSGVFFLFFFFCPGAKLLACHTMEFCCQTRQWHLLITWRAGPKKKKKSFSRELSLKGLMVYITGLQGFMPQLNRAELLGLRQFSEELGNIWGSSLFNHWNQSREGGAEGRKKQWAEEQNGLRWMEPWEPELQTVPLRQAPAVLQARGLSIGWATVQGLAWSLSEGALRINVPTF